MAGTDQDSSRDSRRTPPFELRGGSFNLMVLKLVDPAHESFLANLARKIGQARRFFRGAPVVLDLDGLAMSLDPRFLDSLLCELREQGLVPIGVQGGSAEQQHVAVKMGLSVVPPVRATRAEVPRAGRSDPAAPPAPATVVVTEPVRSGRKIYAPGGDLIVLAPVSAGAELLADGHIHVYAPLRGRALAGVGGEAGARIFCQSLEAELVSIAGLYRVSEDIERSLWKRAVQVRLDGEHLCIEPLA